MSSQQAEVPRSLCNMRGCMDLLVSTVLLERTVAFQGHHGLSRQSVAFLSRPSKLRTDQWNVSPFKHGRPNQGHATFRTFSRPPSTALSMALVPLSVDDLEELLRVSGAPTGEQAAAYWGRTQQERYGRVFEASVVTLLGTIFSYFLSFVLGAFVASILGSIFLFWGIFSPQLQAYQRNWEFRGGRDLVDPWVVEDELMDFGPEDDESSRLGLCGALFLGQIDDVCVVEEASAPASEEYDLEDFADYKMEEDDLEKWAGVPYLIRVKAQDDEDRTLQVHARMSEEYIELEPGQPVLGVMLSTSSSFTKLAALTDLFVPELECWIGDYPYLDRAGTEQLLASDDEIWKLLQDQRRG